MYAISIMQQLGTETINRVIHTDKNPTLTNAKLNLEANKAGSFEFTVSAEHSAYDLLLPRKTQVKVMQNQTCIFYGDITKIKVDFYKNKIVTCEGVLSYCNDTIQSYHEYSTKIPAVLSGILAEHNARCGNENYKKINMGTVSGDLLNLDCELTTNYDSTFYNLRRLLDMFGGYFRIRTINNQHYLDYYSKLWILHQTTTNTQRIALGRNILDLIEETDATILKTCIIPLGKALEGTTERLTIKSINDGKDYLETPLASEKGHIYEVVDFKEIDDATELKNAGLEYIENMIADNVSIELNVVDLNLANAETEQFEILDHMICFSRPHDLNMTFVLVKMSKNILDPASDKITLGEKITKNISEIVERR